MLTYLIDTHQVSQLCSHRIMILSGISKAMVFFMSSKILIQTCPLSTDGAIWICVQWCCVKWCDNGHVLCFPILAMLKLWHTTITCTSKHFILLPCLILLRCSLYHRILCTYMYTCITKQYIAMMGRFCVYKFNKYNIQFK